MKNILFILSIIGTVLLIGCGNQEPLNLSVNVNGTSQTGYYYPWDKNPLVSKSKFGIYWKSTLKKHEENLSLTIDRLDSSAVMSITSFALDNKGEQDTLRTDFIISHKFSVDSIIDNNKSLFSEEFNYSISGHGVYDITRIENGLDSLEVSVRTKFNVTFKDSISDPIPNELLNYVVTESFLNGYLHETNDKLIKDINEHIENFKKIMTREDQRALFDADKLKKWNVHL